MFSPCSLQVLSRFSPGSLQVLSRFSPGSLQVLFRFSLGSLQISHRFFQVLSRFFPVLSRFSPGSLQVLFRFSPGSLPISLRFSPDSPKVLLLLVLWRKLEPKSCVHCGVKLKTNNSRCSMYLLFPTLFIRIKFRKMSPFE
jgi:hypothetical protein